jgi:hypothetical protein
VSKYPRKRCADTPLKTKASKRERDSLLAPTRASVCVRSRVCACAAGPAAAVCGRGGGGRRWLAARGRGDEARGCREGEEAHWVRSVGAAKHVLAA